MAMIKSICFVALVLVAIITTNNGVQAIRAPVADHAFSMNDSCTLTSIFGPSPQVLTNEQLRQCMASIPLNGTLMNMTIAGLRQAMQQYVFRDIVRDSPTYIISLSVDIDAELAAIGATNWDSDYEFQQAISNLYMLLRDPHTLYLKSSDCYGFYVVQPYSLGFVVEGDAQVFYVDQLQFVELYEAMGYANVSSMAGQQVIAIDGMDPKQAVINFGGFISKDTGSLFNWALQNGFSQRPQTLFGLPDNNNMTWSFANGVNVTLPWLGLAGFNLSFSSCYESFDDVEFAARTRSNDLNEWRKDLFKSPFAAKKEVKEDIVFHSDRFKEMVKAAPPSNQTLPLYESDSITVSALNKNVLIMQITSFEPANNSVFLDVVWETLNLADAFEVPYLILDLRGNGGGDICLGYQVINSLMEEHNPYGHYDLIHSELGQEIFVALAQAEFNGTYGSPEMWINPDTQKPYENISWYMPGVQYTRGGVVGNYSQLIHLACDAIYSPVNYLFKKILLFTDGLCGSTCAVFSSHLAMADHVDTVVMGGFLNVSQQYYSFPGGQVFEYFELSELAMMAGVTPAVPFVLPPGADATFALQEIYSWNSSDPDIPLEFLFKPADFHLVEWGSINATTLYNQVAQFFPSL
eukprot:TRINITY_DN2003_c0_g1_i1.p1 TRINITY_DN2003_c0_g1~~TRINITY_DN2003_c0_g1_i1.p1  ORF type:complete len:649 (-),score=177.00 TRINITY_DN2003_c0_g1_i1:68-1969(-)